MSARRGFTMLELMIAVSIITLVAGSLATAFATLQDENDLSSAYAADLAGLRRAARTLRTDLEMRAAEPVASWHLEAGALRRDGVVIARHIAHFDLTTDGPLAKATITLAPRSKARSRREATIAFTVRQRLHPGGHK